MPFGNHEPIPKKKEISVRYLVEKVQEQVHIDLEACAAEDCCEDRSVIEADLHRPGLALAGYIEIFTHQRI